MRVKLWLDYFTIKKSGWFDPAHYLRHNRDCRLADVDPLWHFVRHGWMEGRDPSADFDTAYYLSVNQDIRQAEVNPLVHYLRHGQREGRAPKPYQVAFSTGRRIGQPRRAARGSVYRIGKRIYWRIPHQFRQKLLFLSYHTLGFIFRGMPHYENWSSGRSTQQFLAQTSLIDIDTVPPAHYVEGKIAVHLHIFYSDLIEEFVSYLKNMPFSYDLYVSVTQEETLRDCQRAFINLPFCNKIEIRQVINRGRDIAPFLCAFGETLVEYDFVAHLHTKKSLYNRGATQGWREYLCQNLVGSPDRIRRIFSLLQAQVPCGIVYPQNYFFLPTWANTWLANRELGVSWCARLGINPVPRGYFDYPASSMFWARTDALAPLFQAGITIDDFPEGTGQTDGTMAHCFERMFALLSLKEEMSAGILRDAEFPSWSSWRFDLYVNRQYEHLLIALSSPDVKLIAFDIYDTLFCRPLLNPENIKAIVGRRFDGEVGQLYLQYRAIAEAQARAAKGSEVNMDDIYRRLGELTNLSEKHLMELRKAEVAVEAESIMPRSEVIYLYRDALATCKPVALISDMFLPRAVIEACLHKHDIDGWHNLFVSNEVGLRKDKGELYRYVLRQYNLIPDHLMMVGDNERSDIQIPCDMGAAFIHLLRPVELARGLPRFSALIEQHERRGDIDAELTLGLVVCKNFSHILYPNFDPDSLVQATHYHLGYSLAGPLLVSFVEWLLQTARQDGIERLYFLSREGKLIHHVYQAYTANDQNVLESDYLVISRRAAGVAVISTLEDILDIAKTIYFSNSIENFLYTRYGLSLSDARWDELSASLKWDRASLVSVQDRRIGHLIPLLQALAGEIMSRAADERAALLRYLSEKGLTGDEILAVVDVGYRGSVQGYLIGLLDRKVHGYYMMTNEQAAKVMDTYNVFLRGCFYELVAQSSNAPTLYKHSFDLEKLLSSDDPQVEYYQVGDQGQPQGHFRPLTSVESTSSNIRAQLQKGVMDYVADVRKIRENMLPDFRPSCWTAQMLMEAFLAQKSRKETELLAGIVLDDYYCGRGLVR